MRRFVICDLSGSTVVFHVNLIRGTIFGRKLLNIKDVFGFCLQLLSKTFLILRKTEGDMVRMYISLHVKYLLFFFHFKQT